MTAPASLFLVDDQPEMELIVRRLGRRAGYEVAACSDVESAWHYLTTTPVDPDLILLDVNMPGLSGLELCRRLRAEARWRKQSVAVFSHWDRGEEIHAALAAGADFVFPKDLVAQPAAWQIRLNEILQDRDGRPGAFSLNSLDQAFEASPVEPGTWYGNLNRALSHLPLRSLEVGLAVALTRRAILRLSAVGTDATEQLEGLTLALDNLAPHLRNSAGGFRILAQHVDPRYQRPLTLALAEQLRYAFGSAAVSTFQANLFPGEPPGGAYSNPSRISGRNG